MEDFFNQFKANLENRPEPPFDERAWREVERSLNQEQRPARTAPVGWWLAAAGLLLLLLAANAWTLLELRRANHRIAAIELQRDTVFKTQAIHVTDTIYRTNVIRETAPAEFAASGNRTAQPSAPSERFFAPQMPDFSFLKKTPRQTTRPLGIFILENKNAARQSAAVQPEQPLGPIDALALTAFPTDDPDLPLMAMDAAPSKQQFNLLQRLYPLRPTGFRLGPVASLTYPHGNGMDTKLGYAVGVHGQVEFPFRLRAWFEYSFGKSTFDTDRMGDDIGVPIVTPPDDNLSFSSAEVPQPYLQFALGMQYIFDTPGRTQPIIGLGLSTLSVQPYDIVYEFQDEATGIEWQFENMVEATPTFSNNLLIQGGLEREIGKRLHLQLLATYRTRLEKDRNPLPQMLGLQSNVLYRF